MKRNTGRRSKEREGKRYYEFKDERKRRNVRKRAERDVGKYRKG
jgi:hypothetical protein